MFFHSIKCQGMHYFARQSRCFATTDLALKYNCNFREHRLGNSVIADAKTSEIIARPFYGRHGEDEWKNPGVMKPASD